jgi:hypothetical protein
MPDYFAPGQTGKIGPGGKTIERRRGERLSFSAVAEVTEPSSKASIAVRIADLGLNGCYADSLSVFPVGTVIKVSIRHSGKHFQNDAKVVYAKTGMGMGLNFMDMSSEMQSMVQEWLYGNKGEAVPTLDDVSVFEPAPPTPRKGKMVLIRLIELMMYKGQLTELEGRDLIKELQQDR